jgi:hypothetical protein
MSSIKQLIVNAIIKVSQANPALDREGEPTAEQARDDFIKLLLAELFPEDSEMPVPAAPKKTKKTKKTVETPAPTPAVEDSPPALEKVTEETAAPTEAPAVEAPAKKKRAPMTEEAKAAMKAKRDATLAAKKAEAAAPAEETAGSNAAAGASDPPAKEKKPRKSKTAEGANLAKIDPTWRKHIKSVDKAFPKERESELLAYLNGLTKEEFDAKKAEDHVRDFLASGAAPKADDGKVEADLSVVEFNGKEYFVNPETKRVYEGEGECDADGNWTNYKGVGYVGMAAFAEMKLED